jgi:hypothetical protein
MGQGLSYSVRWGDESGTPVGGNASAPKYVPQQTATFTHAYAKAGTYQPTFYVGDGRGGDGSAQASLTVTVGPATQSDITVTSPNGGEQWVTYETKDITWNWPNAKRTDKVDLFLDPVSCVFGPTTNACTLIALPSLTLDKNISARATYNWIVATDIDNKLILPGNYRVRVCQAGTSVCDTSDNYFTIAQPSGTSGIFGRVIFTKGNCMPMAVDSNHPSDSNWTSPNPCASNGVARELIVHKPVVGSDKPTSSSRVATVTSNDQGYYALQLKPGQYSIYVNENGKEWCSLGTGNVHCLVTVNPDEVLEHNINIDYQASY